MLKEAQFMMPDRGPDASQPSIKASTVIRNIGHLVTVAQQPIPGASGPLQVISHAALAVRHGVIVWIGPDNDAEPMFQSNSAASADGITIIDAEGAVVTPGLVDSHTHLVFAGDRAEEFHLRHSGISYTELLAQGRGILTTVQATRSASTEALLALAQARLETMRLHGTTTVEIKTGYGLDRVTEEASLRIINMLMAQEKTALTPQMEMRIIPTFLGAHVLPQEYH